MLVTVVEHPNYLKRAEKLLSSKQIEEIADILASDPDVGEIMQGTGGCRKMRYAGVEGKGKSGGVRVIHLFVTTDYEVHLVDIFGKGEKSNLTKAERNELAKLAEILKGE
ncbi:MAG: addiction module toxin RelE [Alphaproteobacteria bacterium]|nr:addiction module toxin RelE [Alphaproteobacteria bacterium]MCB1550522.1 addiction module toxin RelE [Alphaproteobacteria bacterium]